jgi:hypothetical protein
MQEVLEKRRFAVVFVWLISEKTTDPEVQPKGSVQ